MTQTALITGINGFIGMHLARRLLSEGWTVAGVVHRNRDCAVRILKTENIYESPATAVDAVELLNRVQPDVVFHLATSSASEVPGDVDNMIATNIVLGAVLLEASSRVERRPRFITAGSFWEYSGGLGYSPNTLYAATKHSLYDLLIYYRDRRDLLAVSLLLFDTYGPDDQRDKLWNRLLKAEHGAHIELTPGEQLVDLVHVRDVVSGFIHAAELLLPGRLPDAAYALSSLNRATLRSIAETICRLTENTIHLEWGAKAYRPTEIFDPWNGPRLPGWSPRVSLEEGISELMRVSLST